MLLSLADIDTVKAYKEESPKFKTKEGRFDPFNHDNILHLAYSKSYSKYLKKLITNVEEACWHAKYMTEEWAQQDEEEQIEKRKQQNIRAQKAFRERQRQANPEAEAARNAWKHAVAQRKEVIAQWDVYVSNLHREFLRVKVLPLTASTSANSSEEQQ